MAWRHGTDKGKTGDAAARPRGVLNRDAKERMRMKPKREGYDRR